MNQLPQTGKRIVSKGEYARRLSKKAGLSTVTIVCTILAAVSFLLVLVALAMVLIAILALKEIDASLMALMFFFLSAAATIVFASLGYLSARRAQTVDTGVPLTRANTADLPAPDSLVRASAEPVQEQEAVLLRAATPDMEKHEEQLVRAAEGTE